MHLFVRILYQFYFFFDWCHCPIHFYKYQNQKYNDKLSDSKQSKRKRFLSEMFGLWGDLKLFINCHFNFNCMLKNRNILITYSILFLIFFLLLYKYFLKFYKQRNTKNSEKPHLIVQNYNYPTLSSSLDKWSLNSLETQCLLCYRVNYY